MTKSIETVPEDIDLAFKEGVDISDEHMKAFLDGMEATLRSRLSKENKGPKDTEPYIRMSKIGTPDRKLWYEFNTPPVPRDSSDSLKFLYGDVVEELMLFFLKVTGHIVEDEQGEVTIDGVTGHQDCKVDGWTTDIKSASSYGFKKFAEGRLTQDDPFGYIAQLSSYMYADDNNQKGAFLVVNKENGKVIVDKLHPIDTIHPPTRIKQVREAIALEAPPTTKCYEPMPAGKSGNMKINTKCNWCPYKDACWSDANGGTGLRRFQYASGVVALTDVVSTPRVEEVFLDQD